MTSRRLRAQRQRNSVAGLLAQLREENAERQRQQRRVLDFARRFVPAGEVWPDAARWTPELLEPE